MTQGLLLQVKGHSLLFLMVTMRPRLNTCSLVRVFGQSEAMDLYCSIGSILEKVEGKVRKVLVA